MRASGPVGPVPMWSVAPNTVTVGTARAEAMCIAPESFVIIALHAAVESDPSADAQSMNERIWAELIESTRRRQFQARIG